MEFKFNSKQDYVQFQKYLKSLSKEESVENKKKHVAILNTKMPVICLQMSEIRKLAKQIVSNDPYGFLKLAQSDTYEEVLIQGLVIVQLKNLDEQIKQLEIWKDKSDCWAHVDSVCSTMKILKKSKEKGKYFDYFLNLCFSEKEFVARLGIITLMVNFLEEEYVDKILKMCEKVNNDAYYVKMGIAWLVSFSFVKFREQTLELIEKKCLDKFTQNKVISKCRESFRISNEDKQMLINFKI